LAIEMYDELILDRSETVALLSNMIHPNTNALRLRDDFLRRFENVVFNNGEIIAVCPEISLPARGHSLYDEKPSSKINVTAGTIRIEQGYEVSLLSTPVFTFNKQNHPPRMPENEKWTWAENAFQATIPTAA